ncbi:MAG TPA: hypothetical protein VF794_26235 [Archangium sp.]|jgi:hypothetical protein|uniref:hypothetical protein n=1 Tax=Archangium sp. TaxID=1872627 RepID=UPI002ED88502
MNESEMERNAAPAPDEQATEQDRPEEKSAQAGKATTAPPDEIKGCAVDTIQDDDGRYLEPPD